MEKTAKEADGPAAIEQEEIRGISRSVAEIEWLLLIVVLLYHVFGGTEPDDGPLIVLSMVLYTLCIMGLRYVGFFRGESRGKLAVETWIMTAFVTWAIWHTGRLESPLLNSYLLIIITSALALGKVTTLLELALIATCYIFLGSESSLQAMISLKFVAGIFAQFAPIVLVAYIATMFASDIRYGLREVKQLSETDALTATLNRRGFDVIADRLFSQAARYGRPISLLGMDCDNLKQVNDSLGHKAGDALLISLVKSIQKELRNTDILARQGGDEFVVLLPETPASGALEVAEKIRATVAANSLVLDGKTVGTTISIGVVSYPGDGATLDLLLANADYAMYQAKLTGRNRIVHRAARPADAVALPRVDRSTAARK